MTDSELIEQLHQKTQRLVWPSEADYPWEVVTLDSDEVEQLQPYRTNQTLDHFFRHVTQEQDWHNEAERTEVWRYQELKAFLQAHLQDMAIYKKGEVEVEVYILGHRDTGAIGIKTTAIQT